jgi:hypothetical protein
MIYPHRPLPDIRVEFIATIPVVWFEHVHASLYCRCVSFVECIGHVNYPDLANPTPTAIWPTAIGHQSPTPETADKLHAVQHSAV